MNILELQRRYKELQTVVTKALDDERLGKRTGRAFIEVVQPAVDEANQIEAEIKMFNNAQRFAGLAGADGGITQKSIRDNGKRLVFGTKSVTDIAAKMMPDETLGTKALAPSGSTVVGQEFRDDPIALGKPAHSLLDVLPVQAHDTPEFSYLRQSVRTNNAAVVAEGAIKPTSVYSVVRVEESLDVVAHLSEGISRYWLIDNASVEGFVANELQYGLRVAVEAKVLADINATSGTQAQAYATSPLATLRKSLTLLEQNGYEAGYFVLDPIDWEGIELALASTNAVDYQGIPYDAAARRLFGVPVVVAVAQAAGVSHTIAKDAVVLDTDTTGTGVQWSETSNDEDFSRNLIRARCEGRFATSIYAPLGVVVGDLTAA